MDLSISKIFKKYNNGIHALSDVTLKISPGMFGLLGPNGAGKSTLMRILATLQDPDEGNVFLGDIDVVNEKHRVRETLGYLPQEFGLLKNMSAEDMLTHFAALKGVHTRQGRRAIADHLLKQTNLWHARKQKLGGYSGGMRQRFGVAVALIGNPKLLIVDEPTAGLDPSERVRFLNLLSELGENSVVILSTHIVEDVAELCTNMAVIDRGKILLQGEPLRVVNELAGKIWSMWIKKEELSQVEKVYDVVSTKLSAGKTFIRIFAESAPGSYFQPSEPSLEDVYFCVLKGFLKRSTIVSSIGTAL